MLALGVCIPVSADDEVFDIVELSVADRVVSAQVTDLNGDGRRDLFLVTIAGMPPAEVRTGNVLLQTEDGTFSAAANLSLPVPEKSAVYDVANLDGRPGDELLFLRPDRLTVASFAHDDLTLRDLPVDGPTTVAAATDERGLERYPLVFEDFADGPWILVPQIGSLSIMNGNGETISTLDVGGRANYFVAEPASLLSLESDLQLYLDTPKMSVADIDGDGRADLMFATRHEIRTFLRDDGGFKSAPTARIPLEFIDDRDHLRSSGGVTSVAKDVDGDGRADLLVSHVEGTLTDTVTRTYLYKNRNGEWNLNRADETFVSEKVLSSDLLLNIDTDPELELIRIQIKFTIFEMVELLLQRKLDAIVAIHELGDDGRYGEEPDYEEKISTGIDFDTFRPKGFTPRGEVDLNADGRMDFVTSANGDAIEVYLGSDEQPFDKRSARQKMATAGVIGFDDIDGDGYQDFVLYDPQSPGAPVYVGRNLGTLPK